MGLRAAGLTGFDAEAVTKKLFPDGEHQALVVINISKPGYDAFWPRTPP